MTEEIARERAARVAAAVKTCRETAMMTQEELALACDLSERTIRRIEAKGEASFETLRSIAAVLPINIAQIHRDVTQEYIPTWKVLFRFLKHTVATIALWWCVVAGVCVCAVAFVSEERVTAYEQVETDDSPENKAAWEAFWSWHKAHNHGQSTGDSPRPAAPVHMTTDMTRSGTVSTLWRGLRLLWTFSGIASLVLLGIATALGFPKFKEAELLDQRFGPVYDRFVLRLKQRLLSARPAAPSDQTGKDA